MRPLQHPLEMSRTGGDVLRRHPARRRRHVAFAQNGHPMSILVARVVQSLL